MVDGVVGVWMAATITAGPNPDEVMVSPGNASDSSGGSRSSELGTGPLVRAGMVRAPASAVT